MSTPHTTANAVVLDRRSLLRTIAGAAAAAAAPRWAAAKAKPAPLNFIVMMADDLGAKELGCYGNRKHATPHLDRLAKTGVKFETCYTAPICHPTRFEIMTGQYGCHNGVFQFAGRPGGPRRTDAAEQITSHFTFGHLLKKAGYATALSGKWQLSGKVPTLVYEAGFDEYCMWAYKNNLPPGVNHTGGWEGKAGGKTSRYWHPSIVKNARYVPTKPDDYGPDIFTDFVIDFATRKKDRPFFIYFPMALTHNPRYTTPDTTRSRADRFKDSPANFKSNVEYMDKLVGRIVAALDKLGIRDRTVVFFTGDNGTGGSGKGQVTELGARVPMIVNCPGVVKPLGDSRELVDMSDVFPTLADLAGADLPTDRPIDGRSFAPLLRGETFTPRDWVFAYLAGGRVLRTKRWLLEKNTMTKFGRLYDCGDSRNGKGYRDVTNSTDPEVAAVRKKFNEILKALPSPVVKESAGGGKKGAGRGAGGRRGKTSER